MVLVLMIFLAHSQQLPRGFHRVPLYSYSEKESLVEKLIISRIASRMGGVGVGGGGKMIDPSC